MQYSGSKYYYFTTLCVFLQLKRKFNVVETCTVKSYYCSTFYDSAVKLKAQNHKLNVALCLNICFYICS